MKKEALLAKLANLIHSKKSILTKLSAIHALESKIEARIISGLKPVLDETGVTLSLAEITLRIKRLASELMDDHSVNAPILISVMDGALPFAATLQKELSTLNYNFQYATIQVSSYDGTESGVLSITSTLKMPVGGRDVIVVDDVCDTGKTYNALRLLLLHKLGANSVRLMALIDKKQPRDNLEANPTYSGFTVSKDAFVAGWGMDYDGLLRNYFKDIGAVDPSTLPSAEEKVLLKSKKPLNIQLQACSALELKLNEQLRKDVSFDPDSFYFKCLVGMSVAGAALTALSILLLNPVTAFITVSLYSAASVAGLYYSGFFAGVTVANTKAIPHVGASPFGPSI